MEWQMPIIHLMTTGGLGDPGEVQALNYYFSLMIGLAFLLFMPCAAIKILTKS